MNNEHNTEIKYGGHTWNYPLKHRPQNEISHGDWLFTCRMEPLQFDKWLDDKKEDFQTIEGSSHSKSNCSLKPISTKYATWFNENKIWELYKRPEERTAEKNQKAFDDYEALVKQKAKEDGVEYEGW